jgi:hypothetical protein
MVINKEVTFMGDITNLNKATTKNESLRTTVPRSIIKQFSLTEYDKLEWFMKVESGELIIQVKTIKTGKTE